MTGEWKWTAELIAPFAWPVMVGAGVYAYVRFTDRRTHRRLEELDEACAVWEQIDRELMITGHRMRETPDQEGDPSLIADATVARLDAIPHGDEWDIPAAWRRAA